MEYQVSEDVNLSSPDFFIGKTYGEFTIDKFVDRGRHGMVFHSTDIAGNEAACKILESSRLRPGWELEAKKAGRLTGLKNVVQYKACGRTPGGESVYLLYEFVHGKTLKEFLKDNRELKNLQFVEEIAETVLAVCNSIRRVDQTWSHGDLHEGNIMISDLDERFDPPERRILVTDFGIGNSINGLEPKDDLVSLAYLLSLCLKEIDSSELGPEDKYVYDNLSSSLLKRLEEYDPTTPLFSEPKELRQLLAKIKEGAKRSQEPASPATLDHPFDYLNCEQLGETPQLLTKLFSPQFLGYPDLISKNNIIFTGPRGCGKTTVFRNLSLRDQVLAQKRSSTNIGEYFGIYYQASDLRYAFPYDEKINETFLKVTSHYLNISIAGQIFDTLALLEARDRKFVTPEQVGEIQRAFAEYFPKYTFPPSGVPQLTHISRFLRAQKVQLRKELALGTRAVNQENILPLDFLKSICGVLSQQINALRTRPFFIFVDDYSLPKIRVQLQRSLNKIIFQRNPELYFKVSIESIAGIELRDADGNEFEEGREFELIDLGAYFIDPASREKKQEFIRQIVNSRLEVTKNWCYPDIVGILGSNKTSFNEMARQIRAGEKSKNNRPRYSGFENVVDMCSGDISQILLLLRDLIDSAGGPQKFASKGQTLVPIPREIQDAAISRLGGHFIERIGTIRFHNRKDRDRIFHFLKDNRELPMESNIDAFDLGVHLRRITEAIGDVAHWELMNLDSKNVDQSPPKQASRIEIRNSLAFPNVELKEIYFQLLQYGILIRDVRGKSLRGAIVPRLGLRRLLIPKFRLTFSQRDNIGISTDEFFLLLVDPAGWEKHMKQKRRRQISWQHQTKL